MFSIYTQSGQGSRMALGHCKDAACTGRSLCPEEEEWVPPDGGIIAVGASTSTTKHGTQHFAALGNPFVLPTVMVNGHPILRNGASGTGGHVTINEVACLAHKVQSKRTARTYFGVWVCRRDGHRCRVTTGIASAITTSSPGTVHYYCVMPPHMGMGARGWDPKTPNNPIRVPAAIWPWAPVNGGAAMSPVAGAAP